MLNNLTKILDSANAIPSWVLLGEKNKEIRIEQQHLE